jgi:hypothetical protein
MLTFMAKSTHVLLICLLLVHVGCSPCKRIERIAHKHPDCFTALNETKHDTGFIKIADRDSSVHKADSALAGLSDTVFKYITVLQDCNSTPEKKEEAKKKIADQFPGVRNMVKDAIVNAPCLSDTATFQDQSGAVLKLWQEGKEIKYSLSYPKTTYELKDESWPWWAWFLVGFAIPVLMLGYWLLKIAPVDR